MKTLLALLTSFALCLTARSQLVVKAGNDGVVYSPAPLGLVSPALTTPVITGTVTGTYTLGGTITLTSPTLTTPVIGVATGTSLAVSGALSSSSPSAKIGYATGAGGAVTQGTSRTTTVVMVPNPCVSGAITTTADSMAAQTPTTFTVTDSAVAATDVIAISKVSGDVDTFAWVNSVGSGSFTVTLFNSHASAADTTAFVFNFAVIKAVAN